MTKLTSNGEATDGCPSKVAPSTCCQPTDDRVSACCNPPGRSWGKGKGLIAGLIILAAIGVGATSFVKGNSSPPEASKPAASCPAQAQCGAATCTNASANGTSA